MSQKKTFQCPIQSFSKSCLSCFGVSKYEAFFGQVELFLWDPGTFYWDTRYIILLLPTVPIRSSPITPRMTVTRRQMRNMNFVLRSYLTKFFYFFIFFPSAFDSFFISSLFSCSMFTLFQGGVLSKMLSIIL